MDFIGITKNGGLSFAPDILMTRKRFLGSLENGQKVKESIVRYRESHTRKQDGAIFGYFLPRIIVHMNDTGLDLHDFTRDPGSPASSHEFTPPSKESLKCACYDYCGGVGEFNKRLRLSMMDIEQASRFIENILDRCVSNLDLVIPPPNKDWKKLFKST